MPFVVTIVVALLFTSYLLFDPAAWLAKFMQLTEMTWDFKLFILVLGIGYFVIAWIAEKYVYPRLAKLIGVIKEKVNRVAKKRKIYKVVREKMRV